MMECDPLVTDYAADVGPFRGVLLLPTAPGANSPIVQVGSRIRLRPTADGFVVERDGNPVYNHRRDPSYGTATRYAVYPGADAPEPARERYMLLEDFYKASPLSETRRSQVWRVDLDSGGAWLILTNLDLPTAVDVKARPGPGNARALFVWLSYPPGSDFNVKMPRIVRSDGDWLISETTDWNATKDVTARIRSEVVSDKTSNRTDIWAEILNGTSTQMSELVGPRLRPPSSDFGEFPSGGSDAITRPIVLKNGGNECLHVTSVTNSQHFEVADFAPVSIRPAGDDRLTLSITFRPQQATSRVSEAIALHGPAGSGQIYLLQLTAEPPSGGGPIQHPGQGIVTANPNPLDFGEVEISPPAAPVVRGSQLTAGPEPFHRIEQVGTPTHAAFQIVNPVALPVREHYLRVSFTPTEIRSYEAEIALASSPGTSPPLRLTGVGIPPQARIAADPTRWDFGTALVGATRSQVFTITSTGLIDLIIHHVTGPLDSPFRLLGTLPGTLAPGAIARIEVEYSPTEAGQFAGAIAIESNAYRKPVLTLSLTGEAAGSCLELQEELEDWQEELQQETNSQRKAFLASQVKRVRQQMEEAGCSLRGELASWQAELARGLTPRRQAYAESQIRRLRETQGNDPPE